ncbi:MAG: FprA family A-type flavoprotein [Lachnospiraceae bacterium]|nr:FprA family A-type flavoprotein [Lachnospiraceae bacterium]
MFSDVTATVKYIGVNDRDLDLFESQYPLPKGMAYNSYLILDEKVALMDTVDARKTDEWKDNLLETLDGKTLDYIVVQHLEPDHSGSLQLAVDLFPQAKIVGSAKTIAMLPQFIIGDLSDRTQEVKEGDELNLGSHNLKFIMAPMVHWPEVMLSYESSEKILFSADAFGKFGATDAEEEWDEEARRYYFNIVGKYGAPVQALLKKVAGLDIQTICALHGPVIKEDIAHVIDLYNTWSSYKAEKKGVFIAIASIHGNTKAAALKFADMLRARGEEVTVEEISRSDLSECVEKAFENDRMVLAASSYDAGVFLPMQDLLTHLSYKAYQNRKVAIIQNGSWAPTAAITIKKSLDTMKNITYIDPVVTIKSTVKDEDINNLETLADAVVAAGQN